MFLFIIVPSQVPPVPVAPSPVPFASSSVRCIPHADLGVEIQSVRSLLVRTDEIRDDMVELLRVQRGVENRLDTLQMELRELLALLDSRRFDGSS